MFVAVDSAQLQQLTQETQVPMNRWLLFSFFFSLCSFTTAQDITQVDHWLDNSTLVPNFEGEVFQLYLREKIATENFNDPDYDYSNKVVLMIHGFSMSSSAVFDFQSDMPSWMEYLASEGYDVFALDLTGYGFSEKPAPMQDSCNLSALDQASVGVNCDQNYPFLLTNTTSEIDDISAAVEFILNYRDVDSIALLGHSAGAGRALLYAAGHPDQINNLILHGFGTLFGYLPPGPTEQVPPPGYAMSIFNRDRFQDWADERFCDDQLDTNLVDSIWEQTLQTDNEGPEWLAGYVRHPLFESWGLTADTVASIQIPALLLAGEHDNLAPALSVFVLYNDLGADNKVMIEVNRTAHSPYWENRSQDVYSLCTQWLNTQQIDDHTTGVGIYKLNNTFDWVGEFDDITPPQIQSLFPEDDAAGVAIDTDLVLELDENIENLDTFSFISLFRKADLSLVEFIAVGDTAKVKQICTNRLLVDLEPLDMDTEYFVYVEDESFTDRSFNNFEGILDDKKWNFTTALSVSTNHLSEKQVQIFPNPTSGRLHIISPFTDAHIELINTQGQILLSQNFRQTAIVINISTFPKGLYTLKLHNATENYSTTILSQ